MKKATYIFLIFLLTGFFLHCKKAAVEDWRLCEGCGLNAWAGTYSGTGSYYNGANNDIVDGVEVTLEIENPAGNQFFIKVNSPDYYSQSFFTSKTDSNYYFSLANQNSSIQLNLYEKTGDYKTTGVAKKYHWEYKPSDTVLVIDHTLTFELFKNR